MHVLRPIMLCCAVPCGHPCCALLSILLVLLLCAHCAHAAIPCCVVLCCAAGDPHSVINTFLRLHNERMARLKEQQRQLQEQQDEQQQQQQDEGSHALQLEWQQQEQASREPQHFQHQQLHAQASEPRAAAQAAAHVDEPCIAAARHSAVASAAASEVAGCSTDLGAESMGHMQSRGQLSAVDSAVSSQGPAQQQQDWPRQQQQQQQFAYQDQQQEGYAQQQKQHRLSPDALQALHAHNMAM